MSRIAIVALALACLSSRADARGCHEHSAVVGYEKCSRFGEWSRDLSILPFSIDLGLAHHDYTGRPFTLGPAPAPADTGSFGQTATTFTLRIMSSMPTLFYGGLEFDLGGTSTLPEPPGNQPQQSDYLAGLAVAGVHTSVFRFGFGGELAAGGRDVEYGDCGDKTCPHMLWQTRGEIEARVKIDAFVFPRWSFGALVGHSLREMNDHFLMFYTTYHVRAFDGMP